MTLPTTPTTSKTTRQSNLLNDHTKNFATAFGLSDNEFLLSPVSSEQPQPQSSSSLSTVSPTSQDTHAKNTQRRGVIAMIKSIDNNDLKPSVVATTKVVTETKITESNKSEEQIANSIKTNVTTTSQIRSGNGTSSRINKVNSNKFFNRSGFSAGSSTTGEGVVSLFEIDSSGGESDVDLDTSERSLDMKNQIVEERYKVNDQVDSDNKNSNDAMKPKRTTKQEKFQQQQQHQLKKHHHHHHHQQQTAIEFQSPTSQHQRQTRANKPKYESPRRNSIGAYSDGSLNNGSDKSSLNDFSSPSFRHYVINSNSVSTSTTNCGLASYSTNLNSEYAMIGSLTSTPSSSISNYSYQSGFVQNNSTPEPAPSIYDGQQTNQILLHEQQHVRQSHNQQRQQQQHQIHHPPLASPRRQRQQIHVPKTAGTTKISTALSNDQNQDQITSTVSENNNINKDLNTSQHTRTNNTDQTFRRHDNQDTPNSQNSINESGVNARRRMLSLVAATELSLSYRNFVNHNDATTNETARSTSVTTSSGSGPISVTMDNSETIRLQSSSSVLSPPRRYLSPVSTKKDKVRVSSANAAAATTSTTLSGSAFRGGISTLKNKFLSYRNLNSNHSKQRHVSGDKNTNSGSAATAITNPSKQKHYNGSNSDHYVPKIYLAPVPNLLPSGNEDGENDDELNNCGPSGPIINDDDCRVEKLPLQKNKGAISSSSSSSFAMQLLSTNSKQQEPPLPTKQSLQHPMMVIKNSNAGEHIFDIDIPPLPPSSCSDNKTSTFSKVEPQLIKRDEYYTNSLIKEGQRQRHQRIKQQKQQQEQQMNTKSSSINKNRNTNHVITGDPTARNTGDGNESAIWFSSTNRTPQRPALTVKKPILPDLQLGILTLDEIVKDVSQTIQYESYYEPPCKNNYKKNDDFGSNATTVNSEAKSNNYTATTGPVATDTYNTNSYKTKRYGHYYYNHVECLMCYQQFYSSRDTIAVQCPLCDGIFPATNVACNSSSITTGNTINAATHNNRTNNTVDKKSKTARKTKTTMGSTRPSTITVHHNFNSNDAASIDNKNGTLYPKFNNSNSHCGGAVPLTVLKSSTTLQLLPKIKATSTEQQHQERRFSY